MTHQKSPDDRAQEMTVSRSSDDIGLLDLLIVLAKRKKLVLGIPFITALIATFLVLRMPPIYTATTKIVTPQQNQAAASLASQLGAVGGLVGVGSGLRSQNEVYVTMLKSRTLLDNLIERFGFMKRIEFKNPSQARAWLTNAAHVTNSIKDGVITIDVEDEDPDRATELANAFVDELFKFTRVLAVTEASQRRLFLERQFGQARENLIKVESSAREALDRGGLIKVDDQGRAMVETTARLRAQMTAKEVQIGAMRSFASDDNPEMQRAQQELSVLRRELAKVEGETGVNSAQTGKVGKGLSNLRLLRDVKYYEALNELLAKQLELAKIEEASNSSVLQVLDKAVRPDIKTKPKRRQIVLVWTAASLIVAIILAFIMEWISTMRDDPTRAERIQAFKRYLFSR